MKNIVRFRKKPDSVNLTALGLLYIVAGAVQVWYWFSNLYLEHPTWVPTLLHLFIDGPAFLSQVICGYALLALVVACWIAFELIRIGCKIAWMSWSADIVIVQRREHVVEMLKALGFLMVVLATWFVFRPLLSAPDPELNPFFVSLIGTMMAGYGLFAIMKFRGETGKN